MKKWLFRAAPLLLLLGSCQTPENSATARATVGDTTPSPDQLPRWAAQSTIYEVNIRQYSPEGTINAFRKHLGRLDSLGVKILWIMPLQPIGEENRKGPLGSYYSIRDYRAVNPHFGSMADFKAMVEEAHKRGMYVILDWVANHTAFDHSWTREHPDWYHRDSTGAIAAPVEDWSDVADLNYEKPGLRKAMREAMEYWVEEANIDGFRCDVANMVPMDFWVNTRAHLDSLQEVFMLAEAEGREFYQAFDMTYGWHLHHLMNQVAAGEANLTAIQDYLQEADSAYGPSDLRMYFTTNHDENSWNGTVYERLGPHHRNFFVLASTLPHSMPLVYSGQEAGLDKRLRFFAKDTIPWEEAPEGLDNFYRSLLRLKQQHPALANKNPAPQFRILIVDTLAGGPGVLGYELKRNHSRLQVYLNFSDSPYSLALKNSQTQRYNALTGETFSPGKTQLEIPARSHLLLRNSAPKDESP